MRPLGDVIQQRGGGEPDEIDEPSDFCDFGYNVVSNAGQSHQMAAGASSRARLTLVNPDPATPAPGRYERESERNRRRLIYAAIYSVAGLVALGKLLFWWLQ